MNNTITITFKHTDDLNDTIICLKSWNEQYTLHGDNKITLPTEYIECIEFEGFDYE